MEIKSGTVVWFIANWPDHKLTRLSGTYHKETHPYMAGGGPYVCLDKDSAKRWARVWKERPIHPRSGIRTGHKVYVYGQEIFICDGLQERLKRL